MILQCTQHIAIYGYMVKDHPDDGVRPQPVEPSSQWSSVHSRCSGALDQFPLVNILRYFLFHPMLQMTVVTRKEGNVLFIDALNTFYLQLYGVRHMVKDHSDSERKPAAATWDTLSD